MVVIKLQNITSAENGQIKKLSKLKQRKYREEYGLFLAEGERTCLDAAASSFTVECIVMTERYFDMHPECFAEQNRIVTSEKIFAGLSDTKTPQGVLAVLHMPEMETHLSGNRYVYCDILQDPGNAGTIIRTADAMGFDGVVFSCGSVDVYSPKVIRSTMGSVFHIPVITGAEHGFLEKAKQDGFLVSAGALYSNSVEAQVMTKREKQILVVGNEGNGVSDEVLALADETVMIPMQGGAESLNASVAAAILMYEVTRRG